KGMELHLVKEDAPGKGGKKGKPNPRAKGERGEPVHGVERVVLLSTVEMHLYPDANSGFLVNAKGDRPAKAEPAAGPKGKGEESKGERSHVVIRTAGPFHYDLVKDLARFDGPPGSGADGEHVHVLRSPFKDTNEQGDLVDQLLCDHLELQFRRKANAP